MSAQINLYHPRFLKQRDLLTLDHVIPVALGLYVVLALVGGWAWQEAATRKQTVLLAEAQLQTAKEQVDAATKAAATRKPNPQLIAELENAEGLLRRRGEIARLLESGAVGSTGGFADYLRGFARQVPEGLWLTGFTIGASGANMEIRGAMLNPAALPDYIRRLGAEKAFQGRNFASLTMNRADPPVVVRPATPVVAASPAPTLDSRPIEFVLMPNPVGTKELRP
jgi:multidrug efflux pump subunit AcrA (membrane-fusion protein)